MPKLSDNDFVVQTTASRRILSIDLIRGFLLLVILVGHIELPPNIYDIFTGRGRLFVTAAEGFFFMSGLLVGMVYRRKLNRGMKYIFKKMWGRAAELYIASVILTLSYSYIVVATNHWYIKAGLPNPIDWHHVITQTLLLRFDYGWADFLGRFAILMLIAPFVFYFISKGFWKLVLMGIIVAWFFRGENFTLGWQILFNGGMLIGYYWNEIHRWWRQLTQSRRNTIKRSVIGITAISFAFSYATVYFLSVLNHALEQLPIWLHNLTLSWNHLTDRIFVYAQKWTMGPLRVVLFFLWASVGYLIVSRHEIAIDKKTRGLLLVIGQNSLFVYIFHSIVVFVFKFFIPAQTNPLQNTLIVSLALAIVIGGTYGYRYIRLTWPHLSISSAKDYAYRKGRSIFSTI